MMRRKDRISETQRLKYLQSCYRAAIDRCQKDVVYLESHILKLQKEEQKIGDSIHNLGGIKR